MSDSNEHVSSQVVTLPRRRQRRCSRCRFRPGNRACRRIHGCPNYYASREKRSDKAPVSPWTNAKLTVETSNAVYRTASFLDRANKELFEPHCLFAIALTFKPDEQSPILPIDTSSPGATVVRGLQQRILPRPNSSRPNTTCGELSLRPLEPLILLAPEEYPTTKLNEKLKSSVDRTFHFRGDYFDCRAQARYAAENPDSA